VSVTAAPSAQTLWQFSGRVFDLKSLQPIGNVILEFRSPRATTSSVSELRGLYRIDLPAADGAYQLRTAMPAIRATSPAMRSLSEAGDKRLKLATRPEATMSRLPSAVGGIPGQSITATSCC